MNTSQETLLIRYQSIWFTTRFPKIFSSLAFTLLGILFLLSILLFALSPSRDMMIFPRIIALGAVILPFAFLLYRLKKIIRWLFPRQELVSNESGVFIKRSDGELIAIQKLVIFGRISNKAIHISAHSGKRRFNFYMGYNSPYYFESGKKLLHELGEKGLIKVSEKPFLLFNVLTSN